MASESCAFANHNFISSSLPLSRTFHRCEQNKFSASRSPKSVRRWCAHDTKTQTNDSQSFGVFLEQPDWYIKVRTNKHLHRCDVSLFLSITKKWSLILTQRVHARQKYFHSRRCFCRWTSASGPSFFYHYHLFAHILSSFTWGSPNPNCIVFVFWQLKNTRHSRLLLHLYRFFCWNVPHRCCLLDYEQVKKQFVFEIRSFFKNHTVYGGCFVIGQ